MTSSEKRAERQVERVDERRRRRRRKGENRSTRCGERGAGRGRAARVSRGDWGKYRHREDNYEQYVGRARDREGAESAGAWKARTLASRSISSLILDPVRHAIALHF